MHGEPVVDGRRPTAKIEERNGGRGWDRTSDPYDVNVGDRLLQGAVEIRDLRHNVP
jgi:hypothetical protein